MADLGQLQAGTGQSRADPGQPSDGPDQLCADLGHELTPVGQGETKYLTDDHFPSGLLDGAAGDALLHLADVLHHDVALLIVHEFAPEKAKVRFH